jgi:hypothetical protein
VGVKEFDSMLKDFSIKERWSNSFGEDVARYVVSRISSWIDEDAAGCTVICLFTFHFKGALKSFSNSFLRINYWKALPKTIWRHKMVLVLTFLSTFQWVIQPFINILNSLLPSKAPGSGMIKKIQRYYDKGDVTISIISNKEPSQR